MYFFDVCRSGVNGTGKNTGDPLVGDIGFAMFSFARCERALTFVNMTVLGYLTPEVLTELGGHATVHVTMHVTFSRGILSLLFTRFT